MAGLLQVPQDLQKALGRPPKQSPILFQFPLRYVFGQPRKEKWWMWFEVLTYGCVKLQESLRFDSYSIDILLYISEMAVEAQ